MPEYTVIERALLTRYHEIGLTNEELILTLHLLDFLQHGEPFPRIQSLAERMGAEVTNDDIYDLLRALIQKQVLTIEDERQGTQRGDRYDLTPLFQKLTGNAPTKSSAPTADSAENGTSEREVFDMIQQEFGRPLSPIEYETIGRWFSEDHYQPDTVKEAVREAVLNQVYNLKYIDRILLNWKKANRKTRRQQTSPAAVEKQPDFPIRKVLNVSKQPQNKKNKRQN